MPISPIRSSSMRARASACPGWSRRCATARSSIANALGSGVVEARAHARASCRRWRRPCSASDLALPEHRDLVVRPGATRATRCIDRLDEMVIAPAFSDELPGYGERRERARRGARRRSSARAHRRSRSPTAASISSRRRRSRCRPRRCGATAGSSRARSCCGCSWRGPATAGRSCPAASCRIADDVDARAVSLQRGGRTARCLGALRQAGGRDDAAAGAGPHHDPARDRTSAEPRRRQSVLARPLCRARRGDAAAGSGARHPRRRQRRGRDAA